MRQFSGPVEAAAYIQSHYSDRRERLAVAARERAVLEEACRCVQQFFRRFQFRRNFQRLIAFGLVGDSWPAVRTIQRCYRNARGRKRWFAMIEVLDKRYLNDAALRGEAEKGHEWYTRAMNIRRERMYREPRVQAALETAWQAASSATRRASKTVGEEEMMTWAQYTDMSRKLYIAIMRRDDPREAFVLMKNDWERDTRDWPDPLTPLSQRCIDRAAFFRSWFELADVNTEDMEGDTYRVFLERMIRCIVKRNPLTGAYELRTDVEVLSLVKKGSGRHFESRARWAAAPAEVVYKEPARYHKATLTSQASQRDRFLTVAKQPSSSSLSRPSSAVPVSSDSPRLGQSHSMSGLGKTDAPAVEEARPVGRPGMVRRSSEPSAIQLSAPDPTQRAASQPQHAAPPLQRASSQLAQLSTVLQPAVLPPLRLQRAGAAPALPPVGATAGTAQAGEHALPAARALAATAAGEVAASRGALEAAEVAGPRKPPIRRASSARRLKPAIPWSASLKPVPAIPSSKPASRRASRAGIMPLPEGETTDASRPPPDTVANAADEPGVSQPRRIPGGGGSPPLPPLPIFLRLSQPRTAASFMPLRTRSLSLNHGLSAARSGQALPGGLGLMLAGEQDIARAIASPSTGIRPTRSRRPDASSALGAIENLAIHLPNPRWVLAAPTPGIAQSIRALR